MAKVIYPGPLKVYQVQHVVGYRGVPVECEDGFAAMLVREFGFEPVPEAKGSVPVPWPWPTPEPTAAPAPQIDGEPDPAPNEPRRSRHRR